MLPKPILNIYTDGACSGNPGTGGWGAYLEYQNPTFKKITKEIFGYCYETTNNQMEILAAIEALKILTRPCTVNLYTDSKYLFLGITKWIYTWRMSNWLGSNNKPIKNICLWQKLQQELNKHIVVWYWIKAHADNYGNIIADRLALKGKKIAIDKKRRLTME